MAVDCITSLREGTINCIKLENITNFDVRKTFDCGQCFRFEEVKNSRHACEFSGVAYGKLISVAEDDGDLYIYNTDEKEFESIWRSYLGLDRDYNAIAADILSRSQNPALREAVRVGRGIRILRQEPWETVCSFIISQNNNIPRIKKIISALSAAYGNEVNTGGMEAHGATGEEYSFPAADRVLDAGIDGIFALKTGFRAKYIIDAAEKCTNGSVDLSSLSSMATADAAEKLKTIKGIGDKVAACSLLFGFGQLNSFPVDVWIRRVIERYFGDGFSPDALGPYAGVAQQFLFYYERWLGGQS